MTFEDGLALLVDQEYTRRMITIFAIRFVAAAFPMQAAPEDLDLSPPGINRRQVSNGAVPGCSHLNIGTGPTDRGTFVAWLTGTAAIRLGYSVLFPYSRC